MNRAVMLGVVAMVSLVVMVSVGWVSLLLWDSSSAGRSAPSPVFGTVQTDLGLLEKQIRLPAAAVGARWVTALESDRGLVPSPGKCFLIARLDMSETEIQSLVSAGECTAEVLPAEFFRYLQSQDDGEVRALKNQSRALNDRIIRGTSWMSIQVWADLKRNALFILAEKS